MPYCNNTKLNMDKSVLLKANKINLCEYVYCVPCCLTTLLWAPNLYGCFNMTSCRLFINYQHIFDNVRQ